MDELAEPRKSALTAPQLAKALGIQYRTFWSWAEAGLLRVSRDGTGHRTVFEPVDVVVAVVLAELRPTLERPALERAATALYENAEQLNDWFVLVLAGGRAHVGGEHLLTWALTQPVAVLVDLRRAREKAAALSTSREVACV